MIRGISMPWWYSAAIATISSRLCRYALSWNPARAAPQCRRILQSFSDSAACNAPYNTPVLPQHADAARDRRRGDAPSGVNRAAYNIQHAARKRAASTVLSSVCSSQCARAPSAKASGVCAPGVPGVACCPLRAACCILHVVCLGKAGRAAGRVVPGWSLLIKSVPPSSVSRVRSSSLPSAASALLRQHARARPELMRPASVPDLTFIGYHGTGRWSISWSSAQFMRSSCSSACHQMSERRRPPSSPGARPHESSTRTKLLRRS